MRSIQAVTLFILLLLAGWARLSHAQAYPTLVCFPATVPPGSVLVQADTVNWCPSNAYYNINGYATKANRIGYRSYTNVPVGGTLTVCALPFSQQPIPGWSVIQTGLGGTCSGLQGGDWVIEHMSCMSGDTNCFPSTLTASQPSIYVPYQGTGSVTISWYAPGITGDVCVWWSVDGGAKNQTACGNGVGSTTPAWLQGGHVYTFYLYLGHSADVSLANPAVVTTIADSAPQLWSSPSSPITIPYGSYSAQWTLNWNAPGYSQVTAYAMGNLTAPNAIICIGNGAGSGSATQIVAAGQTISVYLTPYQNCKPGVGVPSLPSTVLATLTMVGNEGVAPPSMSASPNPVVLLSGQTSGSWNLIWSAPGYGQVTAYAKGSPTNPNQIVCIGNGPESGTAGQSITRGQMITVYLTSNQNCAAGSTVSALPSAQIASPVTVTTN